jgi:lipid-A-disaccharide synthase
MTTIIRRFPDLSFGVATVNNLDPSLYTSLAALPNVRLIHEDTYDLLQHASAAIVTSGTATLETALFRVPEIVVYRTDALSYSVARKVVRVKFISLVNLIAGKEVVKELIQNEATPENVGAELKAILSDAAYRQRMLDDYDSIIKQLDTGSASENAARLMVKYLKR